MRIFYQKTSRYLGDLPNTTRMLPSIIIPHDKVISQIRSLFGEKIKFFELKS